MTSETERATTLPSTLESEAEDMSVTRCVECEEPRSGSRRRRDPRIVVHCYRLEGVDRVTLQGIITCRADGHRWPIVLRDDSIAEVSGGMPLDAVGSLPHGTPDGIAADVEDAEFAHFYRLFRPAVVMCRRAVQLGLEEKVPSLQGRRLPLGPLLEEVQKAAPDLLTVPTYSLALGIKDFGDAGAHRHDEISEDDARMVISVTVRVLRELFG